MSMAAGHQAPLIGRDTELDSLLRELDAARDGRRAVVTVQGPAGIGKTRLVDAMIEHCDLSRERILRAGCQQREAPPYLPFLSFLRQLARATQDRSRQAPVDAAVVALTGGTAADSTASSDHLRASLFLQVADVIEDALADGPLLFILEDAHWLDEPGNALLEFVAGELTEATGGAGVLFVVTTRPGELGTETWNPGGLEDRAGFSRLQLRPLSENDRIEAALAFGLSNPAGAVLRELVRQSRGNPLYIREAVNLHLEDPTGGHAQTDAFGHDDYLETLVNTRLSSFPEAVKRTMAHAAVLGPRFTLDQLQVAVDSTDDPIADHARVAVERGMLQTTNDGLVFTHTVWQDTCYQLLFDNERRAAHDRIATALIQAAKLDASMNETALPEQASIIRMSRHLLAGSRRDHHAIAECCERAGDLLYASTAWSDAAECLAVALEAVAIEAVEEAADRSDVERQDELRIKAARAHERDMDVDVAAGYYKDLSSSARERRDLERWAVGVEGSMRLSTAYQRQAITGKLAAEPLAEFLEELGDEPALRAPILRTWAELETTAGRLDSGSSLAGQAVTAARRAGDRTIYSNALFAAGYANLVALRLDDAIANFRESETLRREPGQEWLLSESLSRRSWAHLLGGDLQTAAEVAETAVEVALRSRCWSSAALGEAVLAATLLGRGDLGRAATTADLARRHASRSSYPAAPLMINPILASVHRLRGDHSAGDVLLASWADSGMPGHQAHRMLLDHDLKPPALGREPRCPRSSNLGTLAGLGAIVELAAARETTEQLTTLDGQLRSLDGVALTTSGQLVLRLRGIVAALNGDHDDAIDLLEAGAKQAEQIGALTELARCQLHLATVTEDHERSQQWAAIGRDMAQRLGFAPHLYSTIDRELIAADDRAAPKPEQLTVVFSDLVGSTHMSVVEGDRAYLWAVDQSREILRARCADHNGVEFGTQGDGFLAFFRSAGEATDFALGIDFDVTPLSAKPGAPKIELKIGLATGRPILREDSLYGATVNLAARLSDLASPGLMVADSDTCRLTNDTHAFESIGAVDLKGFPDLVPVFKLVGRRATTNGQPMAKKGGNGD